MTAIAYAALGLLAIALGGLITFAVKNSTARDEREAARVLASSTAGELVRTKDALKQTVDDLKNEQERADALDDDLAATFDHPDPVGARDRVLQAWKLDHDAARGRAVSMPAPPTAAAARPDDALLKPGD